MKNFIKQPLFMERRPRILLTNDDGVFAPGIRHLWQALQAFADIFVVAPLMEQSASSLSITIRSPLRLESVEWSNGASHIWGVGGTPADCVKLGLGVVLTEIPDIVVSGINRGCNAGRNLLYSGTVAGAIEGVMHDIPSIAFSCRDYDRPDYSVVEAYVPKIVHYVLKHPLPAGTLLNVNFPTKEHKTIKGVKLARQGRQFWIEAPNHHAHPMENHSYYWLGAKLSDCVEEADSDIYWLQQGYVAAVPVHVRELTDHDHLNSQKAHFEENIGF